MRVEYLNLANDSLQAEMNTSIRCIELEDPEVKKSEIDARIS
jgi:hypothetical protein